MMVCALFTVIMMDCLYNNMNGIKYQDINIL